MAVIPRKRASGTVYGVVTSWRGRKYWKLVGPNKREAERVDAQRKREVKLGTFVPDSVVTDASSVRTFALGWLDARRNRSADNDRMLITRHVLSREWFASMRMGDVRSRDVRRLIKELTDAKHLSAKSISLVLGAVRVMFRDAVADDVIEQTPYLVPRGTLKRSGVKRFPYTVDEASRLMRGTEAREQMWNLLAFYTGARCGEICGLRWKDWDELPKPLGALVIERQYDGEVLKTERPRIVPVHPTLAYMLAWWRNQWSLYFLRSPGSEDFIVPRHGHEHAPISMTKSSAYKAWIRSCKAAGVTNRSVHSTRHTFITVARRNGADKDAVELVTHNPKGTIVDRYTTREWAELCAAVACVNYDPPPSIGDGSVDGRSPIAAIDGSRAWTRTRRNQLNSGENEENSENQGNPVTPVFQDCVDLDARVDACLPGPVGPAPSPHPAGANGPTGSNSRGWFRSGAEGACA